MCFLHQTIQHRRPKLRIDSSLAKCNNFLRYLISKLVYILVLSVVTTRSLVRGKECCENSFRYVCSFTYFSRQFATLVSCYFQRFWNTYLLPLWSLFAAFILKYMYKSCKLTTGCKKSICSYILFQSCVSLHPSVELDLLCHFSLSTDWCWTWNTAKWSVI